MIYEFENLRPSRDFEGFENLFLGATGSNIYELFAHGEKGKGGEWRTDDKTAL